MLLIVIYDHKTQKLKIALQTGKVHQVEQSME